MSRFLTSLLWLKLTNIKSAILRYWVIYLFVAAHTSAFVTWSLWSWNQRNFVCNWYPIRCDTCLMHIIPTTKHLNYSKSRMLLYHLINFPPANILHETKPLLCSFYRSLYIFLNCRGTSPLQHFLRINSRMHFYYCWNSIR